MTNFSVIIPTRNRAALFRTALESVLAQTGAEFEVVVVNDGTSGAEAIGLDAIKTEYAAAATFVDLPVTASGHGCFAVMNTGAELSRGDYLCFLDDDDCWTDPDHLAHAARIVQHAGSPVDAMFFDQAAYRGQTLQPGPIWLEDLGARLRSGGDGDAEHGFRVDPDRLLTAHGFSHTNITVVRRDTFDRVGGFDTTLRYEGDRDFFWRLADAATHLRYAPRVCARHNIPVKASLSTTTSSLDKALDQVRLLHKAARHAKHAGIAAYARRHRRYALRRAVAACAGNPRLWPKLAKFLPSLLTRPAPTAEVRVVPTTAAMITAGRPIAE